MKKKYTMLFLMPLLVIILGCDKNYEIGGGFRISYVDMRSSRNVYFENQGIFDNLTVDSVVFDNKYILVRGYLNKNGLDLDTSKHLYYVIDRAAYGKDPSQMTSKGLKGPIEKNIFDQESAKLDNSKTLSW